MDVLPEEVDNEKGSGSRTEIEDEKTGDKWETKDQRADTHTTFYERDIDSLNVSPQRKKRLKRILKRQEGENYGEAGTGQTTRRERKQQNREEDRRRDIEIFASQLSLTKHQKRRTTHLVLDVLDVNSYGNYSAEEVILGVITYVCMEDMGAEGVHVDDRDIFHEIADDIETTMERIKGARQITRDRLSE